MLLLPLDVCDDDGADLLFLLIMIMLLNAKRVPYPFSLSAFFFKI